MSRHRWRSTAMVCEQGKGDEDKGDGRSHEDLRVGATPEVAVHKVKSVGCHEAQEGRDGCDGSDDLHVGV